MEQQYLTLSDSLTPAIHQTDTMSKQISKKLCIPYKYFMKLYLIPMGLNKNHQTVFFYNNTIHIHHFRLRITISYKQSETVLCPMKFEFELFLYHCCEIVCSSIPFYILTK